MLTVEAEKKNISNNLQMNAKAPAVLQVLPRLETGGVERGTVDITAALIAAGRRAIVVSAGGSMVQAIKRAGGIHITLPVDSKNPLTMSLSLIHI